MKSLEKIFLDSNGVFNFINRACECKAEPRFSADGNEKYIFRLFPKDNELMFTYISGKGLVCKKADGTGSAHAVMSDLLAIKNGDYKAVVKFINKYGSFLPLDPDSVESNYIESDFLFAALDRLKVTLMLMQLICKEVIDHKRVLSLTMYLLLSKGARIVFPNGWCFETRVHEMGRYWHDLYSIEEHELRVENGTNVYDMIRQTDTWFDEDEYFEAMGYGHRLPTTMKDKNIYLFRNAVNVSEDCRLAIDFLYNFHKYIGEFGDWDCEGNLSFIEDEDVVLRKLSKDKQLRDGLKELAKRTIKAELDFNIQGGVRPSYDIVSMVPSWHVDYLLAGLHFAVFSMRPNIEYFKKCANTACNGYFLANETSGKQKYCKKNCGNAVAQRKHRENREKVKVVKILSSQ